MDVDANVVETDEYPLIDDYLGKGVEFVEGSSGVKGRLKQSISYWESTICAPKFVLGLIAEGYRLPFVRCPDKCYLRNNRSAVRHSQFVQEAISRLLLNDCIQEHYEPPYCVNPLSVAEGKKLRLVIDLRHVNPCLFKHSFRYEDLHCLSKVFEQNFWFFTWDLESGYHHIDIYSEHQTFLGFAWPFCGKLRYFSFRVLPFGLSSACFCFTKVLRPLVKRWRSMSHCCFVFLDDGISGHPDRVSASAASLLHQKDLKLGGLKLNREKSMLEPMQVGQWLGFVIDTIKMQFRVPPKKIDKLKSNLDSMISSGSATFRGLARVAGFINSLYLAVGPIARLFTRQMHATIQARSFWDCSFSLSRPLQEELRFWFANIEAFNGYGIQPKFTPGAVVFCDASDYAFGGYQIRLNDQPVSGMFSHFESQQSSTFRELKAIFYVIKAHIASLRHKKVKVFTDNENASRIVSLGSPK